MERTVLGKEWRDRAPRGGAGKLQRGSSTSHSTQRGGEDPRSSHHERSPRDHDTRVNGDARLAAPGRHGNASGRLLSMANAQGGVMIVGMDEGGRGCPKCALPPDPASGFYQRHDPEQAQLRGRQASQAAKRSHEWCPDRSSSSGPRRAVSSLILPRPFGRRRFDADARRSVRRPPARRPRAAAGLGVPPR